MGTRKTFKTILALLCIALIGFAQVFFVIPSSAQVEVGKQLEIRVQYEGEPGGKIRTKVVFSNDDLEAIGAHDRRYVNVTRVGTLMKTAAHCVDLNSIISAAGIDFDSIKSFTFRTKDGYTMTFHGGDYLNAVGWYYPNLGEHSTNVDIGDGALQMEAGALDGASHDSVPALAIKSVSIKVFKGEPPFSKMNTNASYRFLTGQTDLSYLEYTDDDGNEAYLPTTENDITAWDSVKYIYGIDVVLKGSPSIDGIRLGIKGKGIKVGSAKKINIAFDGAFAQLDASDVTWSSSDESIATVDENGVVTVKKKGAVTITASGYGQTASITINGANDTATNPTKAAQKAKATKTQKGATDNKKSNSQKQKSKQKKVIVAREISIGDEIVPEEAVQTETPEEMSAAQSLGKVDEYDPKVVGASAVGALAACGGGAVFRVRRFRKDMGINVKGKK